MTKSKLLHLGLAALFSLTAACSGDDDDGSGPKPDADPNVCPAHEVCDPVVDAGSSTTPDASTNQGPDAMPAAE